MVEHAAHNGIDVGSNPAKPNKIYMQFNFKNHQASKTKKYIVKNNIILFSNGANQSSSNWRLTEQELYKLNLNYHKIYNNAAIKVIKNTIFKNSQQIVNSTFFFLTLKQNNSIKLLLNKSLIFKSLQNIKFTLCSMKLNDKIYSIPQLKNIYSLKYNISIKMLYQFLVTNLKLSYTFKFKNQ